jgi:hypothetical protein
MIPNMPVIEAARRAVQESDYDRITLILTAVGVIITALAVIFTIGSVVLGALAVIGYRDFNRIMADQMRQQNEKWMNEFFKKFPTPQELRADLFNKVTSTPVAAPINVAEASNTAVQSQSAVSADIAAVEAVSEPYPEEEAQNESGEHNTTVLDLPPDAPNKRDS